MLQNRTKYFYVKTLNIRIVFNFPVNEMKYINNINNTADEHVSGVASSNEACSGEFKVSKGNNKNCNETTAFIDLLEKRICLWDIFDNEYTKREIRELAYKEIAENLHSIWTVPEIKNQDQ